MLVIKYPLYHVNLAFPFSSLTLTAFYQIPQLGPAIVSHFLLVKAHDIIYYVFVEILIIFVYDRFSLKWISNFRKHKVDEIQHAPEYFRYFFARGFRYILTAERIVDRKRATKCQIDSYPTPCIFILRDLNGLNTLPPANFHPSTN